MRPRIVLFLCFAALALIPALALAQGFHALNSWDGVDVWAVGDAGVWYRSFDRGATWTSGTLGSQALRGVAVAGFNVVVVADSGKIWHSANGGGSWALSVIAGTPALRAVAMPGRVGYAVGSGGTIVKTIDGGGSWTPQTSGTSNTLNAVRFVDEDHGWAVGEAGTALRTADGGAHWLPVTGLNSTAALYGVDANSSTVWIVGANGTARRSVNDGADWAIVNLKLDSRADVRAVSLRSPDVVTLAGGGGFIRSSVDGGETWSFPPHALHGQIAALFFAGGHAWACSNQNRALLVSNDDGLTWNLPAGCVLMRSWQQKLAFAGATRGSTMGLNPVYRSTIYAALGNLVYRSRDDGETWTAIATIPQCTKTNAFIVSPRDSNQMLAVVSGVIARRLVKSDDGGQTWFTTLTHDFGEYGIPMEIDADRPDTVYFGGDSDGLFRSTDGGKNWSELSTTQFRSPCDIIAVPDAPGVILVGDGVTGSGQGQYFKSTDWGQNFTLMSTRPVGASEIPGMACARLRNSTAFGTNWGSGGVQRSQDFGDTWPVVNATFSAWGIDIARDDPNVVIYGVYSGGLTYLSVDGGSSFTTTVLSGSNYSFYARDRGTVFAEQSSGIWKMAFDYAYTPVATQAATLTVPNGGENWAANTTHFITWNTQNVAVARLEYRRGPAEPWQLIAEVAGHQGIYDWTVPDDQTTTAEVRVIDAWDSSPGDLSDAPFTISAPPLAVGDRPGAAFGLWQNQPNPFSGTTRIRYALPAPSPVSLEVFDLSGHRVATLVRGPQGAGDHAVDFGPGVATATGERVGAVPAGVYFYRFQAGTFERTRKMLVLN